MNQSDSHQLVGETHSVGKHGEGVLTLEESGGGDASARLHPSKRGVGVGRGAALRAPAWGPILVMIPLSGATGDESLRLSASGSSAKSVSG